MKLITYLQRNGLQQLAVLVDGKAYDMNRLHKDLSSRMDLFLKHWDIQYPLALQAIRKLEQRQLPTAYGTPLDELTLMSPVPCPASCRDGYAFRQHVEAARRNRGLGMIPQFDEYPVFYFTNHQAVQGPGDIVCMPDHFNKLDFELEVAFVVCKQGKNILAKKADQYIGGLMVMNDMSARTLQMEEMLLNLGPAKGKDFTTCFGPCLVTIDELKPYEVRCKEGHTGLSWDLPMSATVNGIKVSEGNLKDMDWTFAELIERASYGVTLYPGDIIGSGTVGTGCFLELNGTNKTNQWLQSSDVVELSVEGLGTLRNTIVADASNHSILQLKKQQHGVQC